MYKNKMVTFNHSEVIKTLLSKGGEYRKGYIDALIQLRILHKCEVCGKLFFPTGDYRNFCSAQCSMKKNQRQKEQRKYRPMTSFVRVEERLRIKANNGGVDDQRNYKNFLASYALCDTDEDRRNLIYLWESEFPSLRERRKGNKNKYE